MARRRGRVFVCVLLWLGTDKDVVLADAVELSFSNLSRRVYVGCV